MSEHHDRRTISLRLPFQVQTPVVTGAIVIWPSTRAWIVPATPSATTTLSRPKLPLQGSSWVEAMGSATAPANVASARIVCVASVGFGNYDQFYLSRTTIGF